MKPYAAINPFGAIVLVLSKTTALLHSHTHGLYVDRPIACVKQKGGIEHAIAHMMALAMYSGGEPNAIEILRTLRPFTKHEQVLMAQCAERSRTFIKRAEAKESLPTKAASVVALIGEGHSDVEIVSLMTERYALTAKEQKALGPTITKARARAAAKKPQKRTTKKKG